MTDELTPSEKLARMAELSGQVRFMLGCARHAAGMSETPLRVEAREFIQRRLQEGKFAQRNFSGVYIDERFPRPLQSFMEQRLQQLRRMKENEEASAKEKTEPRKESEEDYKFDMSPII